MSYAYLFNYDLIGDSGVGKSCLLKQFTLNYFPADGNEIFLGDEIGSKIITIDNRAINLRIWDTVVDARRYVMRCRCRPVAGALLVYDVTRRESFNRLAMWLVYARRLKQRTIMLIGNKCDLTLQRDVEDVSSEEGEQFAKEHGLLFMEVSAKTHQNIQEVFTTAASKIYKDVQDGVLDASKESSGVRFGREAPLRPRAKTGAASYN